MTPKERFLTAIRGGVPDRVPATPDISNYIPAKRTGLPYWEVFFEQKVPLWRAYLDAMDYFGGEAWIGASIYLPLLYDDSRLEFRTNTYYRDDMDAMVRETTAATPDGELGEEHLCFRADPPTWTQKYIKDFEQDWKKFRWLIREPVGVDTKLVEEVREECAKRKQAFGVSTSYPGFHMWYIWVQTGLEGLTYTLMDHPEILDEWYERDLDAGDKTMKLLLSVKPDYVLFGGSGTITMASPDLAMKYAIPALKRWSKMCKDAGVATMLHSCGKSRALVDMLVEHTDVQLINPLELAPMGDADLAEVKAARGKQIALMGNLHTTQVMLRGTPATVREAAIEAMRAAGPGGGFILSTGDQCGRDTPDENIFALINTAKELGVYDRKTGRLPRLEEQLSVKS